MNWGAIGQLFIFLFFVVVLIILINLTKVAWKWLVRLVGNRILAGILGALILGVGLPSLWFSSGYVVSQLGESSNSGWVLLDILPAEGKAVLRAPYDVVVRDVWATGSDTTKGSVKTYGGSSFPIEIWVKKEDLQYVRFQKW